ADDEQASEPAADVAESKPAARDDLMEDIEQALGGRGEAEPEPVEEEIFELTEEVTSTAEADDGAGSDVMADFEALGREFSIGEQAEEPQADASMDEGPDMEPVEEPEPAPAIEASLDRGGLPDDFAFEESAVEEVREAVSAATAAADDVSEDVIFSTVEEAPRAELSAPVPMASGSSSSFEEGIKEMLRPLLRSWLDENMPRLVKGALEAETRDLRMPRQKNSD
ncbi:MAG: DUF2497 domain-containing protein, partial [Pseudomonadota bacterium]|nr:DUF2497 domain-containing protein [Pseudomonadota bacterium]